jgi:hypothetical protein
MGMCRTAEGVRVLRESEMLVMFVTAGGGGTARNIPEWQKLL